jgi:23S rRNA pseudouridine1911/1915/1917 synthase
MPDDLRILFQDHHLLVVDKPAGVLTQGRDAAAESPSLERMIRRHLSPRDEAGVYLATVHRLDRPVSGVILWALTPKAARRVADQFAAREIAKEYWAIVAGSPTPPEGFWDDWLCEEDTGVSRVQVCREGTPRARQAITRYRTEPSPGLAEGHSWLRLWPRTGRTHQLRVQAAARGLPIVGDALYGSTTEFDPGIALHARSLTLRHPTLGSELTVETAPPGSWAARGFVVGG